MSQFLVSPDLSYNELRNFRVQSLASDPSAAPGGDEARVYYNSSAKELRYHDGTSWEPLGGSLSGDNIDSSSNIITVTDNGDGTVTLGISTAQFDSRVRTSRLDQMAVPTVGLDLNNQRIINLADPTAAANAATKKYVDDEVSAAIEGLDAKQSVRAATTSNIDLSSANPIDGVSPSVGDRVLVKNQSTASQNGIYVLTAGSPAFVRAPDMDQASEFPGAFVFVEEGNTQANTGWVCTTEAPITLGTTAIEWAKFSSQGEILAGSGLDKSGNTLSVDSTVIRTTGNQTLGGIKTFSSIPVLPASDPTTANQAARKAYIDALSYLTAGSGLNKSGSTLEVDSTVIRTTGNQTLGGTKTFSTIPVLPSSNPTTANQAARKAYVDALGYLTAGEGLNKAGSIIAVDNTVPQADGGTLVGNGSATSFTINHNFNTRRIIAQVWRNSSPWDMVIADIEATSLNSVTVRFASAPSSNQFLVVIMAFRPDPAPPGGGGS